MLENKEQTDLLFFTEPKTDEFPGITLTPEEEATLYMSDIGEGTSLSIENISNEKSGAYSVKI